jgi:predicted DsbA family dithiol-disulfide isomerase
MKIEIWSDIMCPFCYIGKRHLEKAIEQLQPDVQFEIEWKSFQLDPTIPAQTKRTNVFEYLSESKGISLERSIQMHEQVQDMAVKAGLIYHFEKAVVGNSFLAHRFIQLAKTKGLGDDMEEALFKAYFTDGKDIASASDLLMIGSSIGLIKEEMEELLQSDLFADAVNSDIEEAAQIGVRGVPFFVFDRKYALSGAQPVNAFIETILATQENSEKL